MLLPMAGPILRPLEYFKEKLLKIRLLVDSEFIDYCNSIFFFACGCSQLEELKRALALTSHLELSQRSSKSASTS